MTFLNQQTILLTNNHQQQKSVNNASPDRCRDALGSWRSATWGQTGFPEKNGSPEPTHHLPVPRDVRSLQLR
jgi:hypothetical protein